MKVLHDEKGRVSSLVLTGGELQRVTDAKLLVRGNFTVASIKKEYGGGYSVIASWSKMHTIIRFVDDSYNG